MHTSSNPKISLPYYDKRFGLQPNTFHYKVKTGMFQDLNGIDCETNDTYKPSTSCYSKHLEHQIGCQVPFEFTKSTDCPRCQLPFKYNGKTYSNCIDKDASQPWCPVATYLDGKAVENSWEFCNENCTINDINEPEPEIAVCESKEELHKYLQLNYDKSRTNPRTIAKELKLMNCPFDCQYKEYSAELVYKKHEVGLGTERLRLILEFDGQTEIQTTFRSLLYTSDMFVSDIGSIFGLLLGISLIDLISNIFNTVTEMFSARNNDNGRKILKNVYFLAKWTTTLCYIVYLIATSISQDLVYLLPEILSGDNHVTFSQELTRVQLQANLLDIGLFKGI